MSNNARLQFSTSWTFPPPLRLISASVRRSTTGSLPSPQLLSEQAIRFQVNVSMGLAISGARAATDGAMDAALQWCGVGEGFRYLGLCANAT